MSTLDKLEEVEDEGSEDEEATESKVKPFRKLQEEAIISLALDQPEFFAAVAGYLKPELFSRIETAWVIAEILNLFEKYKTVPTRGILREHLENNVTVDDPHEEIFRLVNRKSDHREVPIVKDLLIQWARQQAFGLLYKSDAIAAFQEGNYDYIQKLFDEAGKIVDVGDNQGLWLFENLEILFKEDMVEHRTTGFPRLDKCLNNGGPSPKEVLCWLAPTNVGKCHTLDSNIYEEKLSNIYELELENGEIIQIAGFRKVLSSRGLLRVCDLTCDDDIAEIPSQDTWDIIL